MHQDLLALLRSPLPLAQPDGVTFHAGRAGAGYPECIRCPNPNYPEEIRGNKIEGRVVLEVTINIEGKVVGIRVLTNPNEYLTRQAANAVRTWRFKPAPGPEGNTVPVRVPVEVTFRIL